MAINIPGPPPAEAGGVWGRQQRWLTIGLLMAVTAAAFEAMAVATTLPATVRDLGGLALYGWGFSSFMLANLVGITLAGIDADRRGPARVFLVATVLFSVGLVLAGLAPTMPIVILGRAVQGFGAGGISSVAYVAIGRAYPEATRPRMLALLSSAWVVPGLIGPALAGVVVDYIGWRWVFLGLAPLALFALPMALPALRGLARSAATPWEWQRPLAALRLAAGTGLIMAGLGQASLLSAALAAGAGGLLAGPALRTLMPAGTFRAAAGLPAAIATSCLLNLAFFGVDAFLPLGLSAVRGQSATAAGIALTAATIFWTTGSWLQARLAQRHSRRRMIAAGLLLIAAGSVGVAATLAPAVPVALATIAWGVAGLGIGVAYATISLAVLETAQPGQEGTATSAMQLANTLGTALGTGVGGAIIAAGELRGAAPGMALLVQYTLMIGIALLGVLTAGRIVGVQAAQPAPAAEPALADLA